MWFIFQIQGPQKERAMNKPEHSACRDWALSYFTKALAKSIVEKTCFVISGLCLLLSATLDKFLNYSQLHFFSRYELGLIMKETQETCVQPLGQEVPLEKKMATHSSILACRIPWTEEPGGLQSMGLQRVRHNWMTEHTHKMSTLQKCNKG